MIENQRLKDFRKYLQLSQEEFAKSLGIKQGSYSDIERGKVAVSNSVMQKLVHQFHLNPTWYYTGDGKMVIGEPDIEWVKRNKWGVVEDTPEVAPLTEMDLKYGIPFVDQPAFASFIEGYADDKYVQERTKILLPDVRPGQVFAFEIEGDSMLPTLYSGDILVARRVEQLSNIKKNQIYIVAAKQGMWVKRIQLQEGNTNLTLVSDNPLHEPFQVSATDVRHVWHAERRISKMM